MHVLIVVASVHAPRLCSSAVAVEPNGVITRHVVVFGLFQTSAEDCAVDNARPIAPAGTGLGSCHAGRVITAVAITD